MAPADCHCPGESGIVVFNAFFNPYDFQPRIALPQNFLKTMNTLLFSPPDKAKIAFSG
jgi:hypothetical protein